MLSAIAPLVQHWYATFGYGGIILAMALESCLIPLPSEIVMPLAGAFTLAAFGGQFNLPAVAVAGAFGCVIGSLVAYGIGAWGGRPFIYRYGRYVLISRSEFDLADRWFQRWGGAIAFFSRLLPIVRTYISLPAGISRMRLIPFITYTFLGSLIWSGVLAYIGQQLGAHYDTLGGVFHGFDVIVALIIVALVVFYIVRHVRHARAEKANALAHAATLDATTHAPRTAPTSSPAAGSPRGQHTYGATQTPATHSTPNATPEPPTSKRS